MKKGFLIIVMILIIKSSFGQEFTDLYGDYLGQTAPGDTPLVFAPGIVSTDSLIEHSAPTFSPDGKEVFWWVVRSPKTSNEKWTSWGMTMRCVEGRWTVPEVTPYYGGPNFSIDGKRLYFPGLYPDKKTDGPYFIDKQGNDWSHPQKLDIVARFPEIKGAGSFSFTHNGTFYFNGDAGGKELIKESRIFRIKLVNGEYTKLELLPDNINLSPYNNLFPLIAPDESYLIFTSNRKGSLGGGDLYISFHNIDTDTWTEPINMGEPINTVKEERLPGLSPDGKYLFFTRLTRSGFPDFDHDIFWVSTEVIVRLKEKYNIKK
ncbi:MAG: PD40 domain-containing protein [Prolixibacteraceae bacterium]|nr:PD40 domain-containing protein [Prolixibacteraceae bacterium]